MSHQNTKEARVSAVCKFANELFPELKMRRNELSEPTEAFLVKFLVHYLRGFGFRVDPTFNIDCEGDNSRERRIFLIKLCRQVEKILKISFPTRSFTYIDIINPTSNKTLSMLDVLLNYWCYYKLYKKEVFHLVEDRIKQREKLCAAVDLKRRELEERQQRAAQLKEEIAQSQENINKLNEELAPKQLEQRKQQKGLQQQKDKLEELEKQLAEIGGQVRHWEQMAVADSKALEIKNQIAKVSASKEACKAALAQQSQILKERKEEIESNQAISKQLNECLEYSPQLLVEYKEQLKQLERAEKQFAAEESQHRQLQLSHDKQQQIVEQTSQELDLKKKKHEEEAQMMLRKNEEQQALIDEQVKQLEHLKQRQLDVESKLESQERLTRFMRDQLGELFGGHSI